MIKLPLQLGSKSVAFFSMLWLFVSGENIGSFKGGTLIKFETFTFLACFAPLRWA